MRFSGVLGNRFVGGLRFLFQRNVGALGHLEGFLVVLAQVVEDEFVQGIDQEQHLAVLFAEDLQGRVFFDRVPVAAAQEVDLVLPLAHAPDVLLQVDQLVAAGFGAGKEEQLAPVFPGCRSR